MFNECNTMNIYNAMLRHLDRNDPNGMNDLLQMLVAFGKIESTHAGIVRLYSKVPELRKHSYAYLLEGAQEGNLCAAKLIGPYLYQGRADLGAPYDPDAAFPWLVRAADYGDITSADLAASIYAGDRGHTVDYVKAAHYFEIAARGGSASAIGRLGLMYKNGQGVAQDYARALEWFRYGSVRSDISAYEYGLALLNGSGVTQNRSDGEYYINKAANMGYAPAKALVQSWSQTASQGSGYYDPSATVQQQQQRRADQQQQQIESCVLTGRC